MSAKAGSLNVDLTLETARFTQGLRSAGASVGGLGKQLAAAGAVLAASGLVSGLVQMASDGLALASSLGETAKKLGVSAREMQEFRYAASQAGVDQQAMDKGLQKLTRTIGEAARGTGAGAKSFRELGINIRDADGKLKSAGTVFVEVAGALEKVEEPARQAAHQVAIFGRAGQEMAPLMAEGAQGIKRLREEARQLGIVLSDEQIANADETADKIDKLKQALNARIAAVVGENAKEIGLLAEALAKLAEQAIQALGAWLKFRNAQSKAAGEVKRASDYLDGRKDLTPEQRDQAKGLARDIIEQRNGLSSTRTEVVGGGLLSIRRTTSKGNLAGAPLFQSDFQKGLAAGSAGGDVYEQRRRMYEIGFDSGIADKIVNEIDGLAEKAETAKVTVVRSFKEMADDTLSSLNGLASAIRGGGFLDILSSLIGLGMQLGSIGLFGKKVQANLGKPIPAYAKGTAFHPGGLALVGERGPELLHLPRGSAVTPNHKLGSGMRVEVVPSPFFDVRVQENIGQAAPSIAAAGGEIGQRRMSYRQTRRLA